MIIAALLVLVMGLATGFGARANASVTAPLAAHFPGLPESSGQANRLRFRTWEREALVSVIFVVGLILIDAAPWAVLLVAVISTFAIAAGTRRLHDQAKDARAVTQAIEAYAPRVAIPYAGKVGVHVGMWSPWIDRTGIPWCVVARTPAVFHQLAAMYEIPIVQGDIPGSVRVAFYPHGASANAAFIETSDATHVFLGHGDSDKPLSASERVLQYDLITVAGQAAIDRFAASGVHVPAEKLRIIGRPQTEGIVPATGSAPNPATVLYAPTWRHADDTLNVSSLAVADKIVQELLDRGCTVHFRRHFAGVNHLEAEAMIANVNRLLADDAQATGRPHQWGPDAMDRPLIDAFNDADIMVSDVSGIVVDFMASMKPLVMYAAQFADADAFRASHPTATGAYVITSDLASLGSALDDALGDDPLASVRAQQASYFLGGDDRAKPAQRFMELIHELSG